MKVIDLLNKIANGEDTPDKFIYDGMLFERHLDNYYEHYDRGDIYTNIVQFTDEILSDYSNLNDEVKIIEDTPKEPIVTLRGTPNLVLQLKCDLPQYKDWWQQEQENKAIKEDKKIEKFYFSVYQDQKLGGREVVEPLETKINEIIDKLNGE